MDRCFFLVGLLIVLICVGFGNGGLDAAGRPNVVLVMADDQGWGDMAYMGHPLLHTPNFDDAAASGLRFDRFYAAAPVCSPTRASVLTGRHPNRMGVFKWGYPMRPQETTLAEALQGAGYATAHFGKWHLGSVRNNSAAHPGRNGFDHFESAPNFYDNDPIMSHNGTAVQEAGESSVVAADAALEWIGARVEDKQPFFAVVWFGSPHGPHRAAEEDAALYAGQPKAHREFLGEVTGMDRAYGKLRQGLVDLGVRDNTIFWYCSDNGGLPRVGNTGPFRADKGDVYEGGLLVPAILEWPAVIKRPRVTAERCNTIDIFPTILEAVGVKRGADWPAVDGVSLMGLIKNNKAPRRDGMGFWDYTAPGMGVSAAALMKELYDAQQAGGDLSANEASLNAARLPTPRIPSDTFPGHAAWTRGDWKLHRIQDKKGDVTWELYNLGSDPIEANDMAAWKKDLVASMRDELEGWLNSVVASLNGEDYKQEW
ncbi:MAG: sulfatase-like hydrolase/transferase [Planctomycetota bacterium]|jgi:arylsulfatase A-like enzyme